ncbi:MAG: mechanosensitive ion channel family protein [Spirochaetales bacterium]
MESFENIAEQLTEKINGWIESFITTLPNLVVAVVVVVAFGLLSLLVKRLAQTTLTRFSNNHQIALLLATIARLAIVAVGLFIALEILALEKAVTSLLAGVGVVSLALGFAFQDMAANFVAGVVMALRRPFKEGDLVEVVESRGHVQRVTLRSTELETLDGLSIIVPNKNIFQNTIINYTRTDNRRMDVMVGTAYGDDMSGVRRVVVDAVRDVPYRLESRDVELFFEAFGSSSINLVVRIWLNQADELSYLEARSEAMISIKAALDNAGYTIPFPIRTLDFGAAAVGGEQLASLPLEG